MLPKTELIEFFKGVVYYTTDPKTFRSIALSCRDFSKICHDYAPMKKNEFAIEKEYYYHGTCKGKFLPNGYRHEIIQEENRCRIFSNGYLKIIHYSGGIVNFAFLEMIINNKYYYIIKGNIHKYSKNNDIILNYNTCELCGKIHNFSISKTLYIGIKLIHINYEFTFDCVKKKLHSYIITTYDAINDITDRENYFKTVDKIKKRNLIIKSVINYAKSIN